MSREFISTNLKVIAQRAEVVKALQINTNSSAYVRTSSDVIQVAIKSERVKFLTLLLRVLSSSWLKQANEVPEKQK